VGISRLGEKEMVLCGENGFTVVDITRLKETLYPERLFVSSVKYGGEEIADFPANGYEIHLPYKKSALAVEWAALHAPTDQHLVSYKLEGVDNSWQQGQPHEMISYSNLAPGAYTFRAFIAGEASRREMYSMKLVIHPPFWQTNWFRIAAGVIAAFIILFFIYNWMSRQRLYQEKLRSNIEALRSQMNPHFIFNALNSIQSFIYNRKSIPANEYLAKFARLMRMILENSREERIAVSREKDFLELYLELEALRFDGRLTYAVEVSGETSAKAAIPSMLLQPVVENSIKHGFANETDRLHVHIAFYCEPSSVRCEITDNGAGFREPGPEQKERVSFGLKLITERLENLGRIYKKDFTIAIASAPSGTGTFVQLILPVI
jgi:signal transduction histidine kinase